MKSLLILSLLALTINSWGQSLFPEKTDHCDIKMFFLENDKKLTDYVPNDSLLVDFINLFSEKQRKKIKGEIYLQIAVDTIGTPCCISFQNQLNIPSTELDIVDKVSKINKWTPPLRDDKKTNVCLILKIEFTKGYIILNRLGFSFKDRTRKFVELETMKIHNGK